MGGSTAGESGTKLFIGEACIEFGCGEFGDDVSVFDGAAFAVGVAIFAPVSLRRAEKVGFCLPPDPMRLFTTHFFSPVEAFLHPNMILHKNAPYHWEADPTGSANTHAHYPSTWPVHSLSFQCL